MKKTKTLVMILLSLLLVASLFVVAACENKCKDGHTDDNHDGVCDICEEEGLAVNHDWSTGTCSCGAKCPHEVKNAECVCTVCGATAHTWTYDAETTLGTCSGCGLACEGHKWNEDSVCTICEYACPHTWDAAEEACTTCGVPCEHEYSETGLCAICNNQCEHAYWTLGICDKCEMACAHEEFSYGICAACGTSMGQSSKAECTHTYVKGLCSNCGSQDPAVAAESKTYNLSSSSLPTMWNSLDYQSNDATTVTGYTEDGFYSFDYNADKTGYKMVPAMALDFPVEMPITDELAAKWGFEKDENGNYPQHHIWTIELRHDLKYDNGDVINAYSYIETAKRLLDPKAANYRADSLYSGNMVIHNAENYVKAGSVVPEAATKFYTEWAVASTEHANDIRFSVENSFVGNYILSLYSQAVIDRNGGFNNVYTILFGGNKADFDALTEKTWAEISASEELKKSWDAVIATWQTEPDEELHFFVQDYTYPEISWDTVGLYAIDDYTLAFVLDKPLEGFYLHYSIGLPLVHVPTYDKCASTEGGIYTNSYGTSVGTYIGYGPYKLVTHVADSILVFEKNNYWYGHSEENEFDDTLYEATGIVIKQVVDEATRLQMFLKGELDSYGLQEADMKDYQSSKYTYYTEGDSTWFVALNPDFDGLKEFQESKNTTPVNKGYEVNKTVLTIKEFRQALSFSLNRAEYQLTLDPVGSVGKALYSGMIISDPENGVTYRSTEQAKDTILAFWGLTNDVCTDECEAGCKDHPFATKDLAIESITGYDPVGAKELFNQAYELAVEKELISADAIASGKWEVQIMIGQPGTGSSTYYSKGYEYLAKIWTEAVKETKFDGHLTFKQSEPLGSSNFSDSLKNNQIDLLFGVGWTGSALDPYSLIEAYVAPSYQYDPGWDTSATDMIVELPLTAEGLYDEANGTIVRLSGSVYDWHKTLFGDVMSMTVVNADGQPLDKDGNVVDPENKDQVPHTVKIAAGTSANATMRLIILAKIEQAVLEQYDMIPVGLDASASMKCHRLQFETEEYVFGVGRGGLKYLDFTMTDAEWAAAVAEAGGQWNYKVSE
ncbi:MAG: hypothetical protein IJV78_03125 [Clostridia bacterium]|nr:hypothetical protein [Clostridia bacterium]